MKKLSLVVAALAFIAVAGSAFANTIVNKDNTPYDFEITCEGRMVRSSIGSDTDSTNGVNSGCTIQLKGGNSITVKGAKDVIIKDGKISQ